MSNLVCGMVYHPFTGYLKRTRGMPSGSFFTNVVDGICNLLILWYAIHGSKQQSKIHKIYVHGDDVVILSTTRVDFDKLVPFIEKLGMKIKADANNYYPSGEHKVHFLGSL